jgi:hypothetical protein
MPVTRVSVPQVNQMLKPEPMAVLPTRIWTNAQWHQLQQGYLAQSMDEKWDVFAEGQTVYCHRSWTGHGIYAATFEESLGGYRISAAQVERDPDRYRRSSDEFDQVMLELVLTNIVLGEAAPELRARLVELMRPPSRKPDAPPGLIQHNAIGLRSDQHESGA